MNPLDHIMGTREAAALWNVTEHRVKQLCEQCRVIARKLDEQNPLSSWVLLKGQEKPENLRPGRKME